MSILILPYNRASNSARALAEAVGGRRVSLNRDVPVNPRSQTLLVNWGNSGANFNRTIIQDNITMLNGMDAVGDASDKLTALRIMDQAGVTTVPFTTLSSEAEEWLMAGERVYARSLLRSHSGEGITIVESVDHLPNAPLYTKYTPRTNEFRIHVMKGVVIDAQRKARRLDVEDGDVNWAIRNYANGFTYARDYGTIPNDVIVQAKGAIRALNLDFGAVDIIWNGTRNRAYVLEVNTACGLEGTTLERYTRAIQEVYVYNTVLTSLDLQEPPAPPQPTAPTRLAVERQNIAEFGIGDNVIVTRAGRTYPRIAWGTRTPTELPETNSTYTVVDTGIHTTNGTSLCAISDGRNVYVVAATGLAMAARPEPVPEINNELSEPESVQSTQDRVFGVFWNNMLDREVGLFSSEDAAIESLPRSNFYNMHRMDTSVQFGVLPVEVNHA